mmetsp:Transcript_9181/g.14831  ORF Transcript_9181/g.14831 Transcript_9181/m.14831 type:complete len:301 (+) Transcript_9181:93-995(+)
MYLTQILGNTFHRYLIANLLSLSHLDCINASPYDEKGTYRIRRPKRFPNEQRTYRCRKQWFCRQNNGCIRGGNTLERYGLYVQCSTSRDETGVEDCSQGQRRRQNRRKVWDSQPPHRLLHPLNHRISINASRQLNGRVRRRLEEDQRGTCNDQQLDRRHRQRRTGLLLHQFLQLQISHPKPYRLSETKQIANGGIPGGALQLNNSHPRHRDQCRYELLQIKIRRISPLLCRIHPHRLGNNSNEYTIQRTYHTRPARSSSHESNQLPQIPKGNPTTTNERSSCRLPRYAPFPRRINRPGHQ